MEKDLCEELEGPKAGTICANWLVLCTNIVYEHTQHHPVYFCSLYSQHMWLPISRNSLHFGNSCPRSMQQASLYICSSKNLWNSLLPSDLKKRLSCNVTKMVCLWVFSENTALLNVCLLKSMHLYVLFQWFVATMVCQSAFRFLTFVSVVAFTIRLVHTLQLINQTFKFNASNVELVKKTIVHYRKMVRQSHHEYRRAADRVRLSPSSTLYCVCHHHADISGWLNYIAIWAWRAQPLEYKCVHTRSLSYTHVLALTLSRHLAYTRRDIRTHSLTHSLTHYT